MKKIAFTTIVLGVLLLIIGFILNPIYNLIFPSISLEYQNINLFRPWSDPLMSLFFIYPFVLAFILTNLWQKTKSLFKQKEKSKKALNFGLSYWLITAVPGMLITYSSFQVSLIITITWAITGLIQAIFAGIIFTKLNP